MSAIDLETRLAGATQAAVYVVRLAQAQVDETKKVQVDLDTAAGAVETVTEARTRVVAAEAVIVAAKAEVEDDKTVVLQSKALAVAASGSSASSAATAVSAKVAAEIARTDVEGLVALGLKGPQGGAGQAGAPGVATPAALLADFGVGATFEGVYGETWGVIERSGRLRWTDIKADSFEGEHVGDAYSVGATRMVADDIPGVARYFGRTDGTILSLTLDDGTERVPKIDADEVVVRETLAFAGMQIAAPALGIRIAVVDHMGFSPFFVRSDGAVRFRVTPAAGPVSSADGAACNAVAVIAPAGEALVTWLRPFADLAQAVVNLAPFGRPASLTGTPRGGNGSLVLGAGRYLQTDDAAPEDATIFAVASLVGTTRGVLVSARMVDLDRNERATPWGIEVSLEATTGDAGTLTAVVSYRNMTTFTVDDVTIALPVAAIGTARLYAIDLGSATVTIRDLTAGTSVTSVLPGARMSGPGRLRIGAARADGTGGDVTIRTVALYRRVLSDMERGEVAALIRAQKSALRASV